MCMCLALTHQWIVILGKKSLGIEVREYCIIDYVCVIMQSLLRTNCSTGAKKRVKIYGLKISWFAYVEWQVGFIIYDSGSFCVSLVIKILVFTIATFEISGRRAAISPAVTTRFTAGHFH